MEDSAYNSLMVSIYIIIFITAIGITVYLFSSTVKLADKAYEYGKLTAADSIIETTSAPKYNAITGAELLSYYYNYKSPDKYGTAQAQKYDFTNISTISVNKLYTLTYLQADTGHNPIIKVEEIASEQSMDLGTPIVVNMQPTVPTITTYPNVVSTVTPGTRVEIKAQSQVTYSIATNTIASYIWRIDYSPEDGRPDFTTTTTGAIGQLTNALYGANIEFRKGTNTIYVTAVDVLGNISNPATKTIDVAYNNPIINSLVEAANKVYNYGTVSVDSPSGVALSFVASATTPNPGAYIAKYDFNLNGVSVQSNISNVLNRNYAPGTYNLIVTAYDSIAAVSPPKTFTFTVGNIPAPTVTCSNSAIISAGTISIATGSVNLTFTAASSAIYGITKYEWNIDGTAHETISPNGFNQNYGIGTHTISVYGVNSLGTVSDTKTITFTIGSTFTSKDFTSVGTVESFTILATGKYKLEVWGAQGGGSGNSSGGNGGYSYGEKNLTAGDVIYVCVGGVGGNGSINASSLTAGGLNGGGAGGNSDSGAYSGGGGGGGTDIRIGGNTLADRKIIAGGGGGATATTTNANGFTGGSGGNTSGTAGSGDSSYNVGQPGTQTSGGIGAGGSGSLGQGGNGIKRDTYEGGGGGGGGYYGGGGGNSGCGADGSGGGGSGYTTGLSNPSMLTGNNSGNGKAKITLMP